MKQVINVYYVECKTTKDELHCANGIAWIGKGEISKSGKTLYFNGKAFTGTKGRVQEYYTKNADTDSYYWISGVKKDGNDRHRIQSGLGKIFIDKDVVEEYLKFREIDKLPKHFEIIEFSDNKAIKEELNKIQNSKWNGKEWITK